MTHSMRISLILLACGLSASAEAGGFGVHTFVNIVPRNPLDAAVRGDMLGLIFFTLVFGIALTLIPRDAAAPVLRVLDGVGQAVIVMIGFAMAIAPIGVFALIFGSIHTLIITAVIIILVSQIFKNL